MAEICNTCDTITLDEDKYTLAIGDHIFHYFCSLECLKQFVTEMK